MFNQFVHAVDHIGAVRVLNAAEQGLNVIVVENANIDEGCLVTVVFNVCSLIFFVSAFS